MTRHWLRPDSDVVAWCGARDGDRVVWHNDPGIDCPGCRWGITRARTTLQGCQYHYLLQVADTPNDFAGNLLTVDKPLAIGSQVYFGVGRQQSSEGTSWGWISHYVQRIAEVHMHEGIPCRRILLSALQ